MKRIEFFHKGLLAISRESLADGVSRQRALARITERAAELLEVDRVGVWLIDRASGAFEATNIYDRPADQHSAGERLEQAQCRELCRRLESVRVIIAPRVEEDPCLAPIYRDEHGRPTACSVLGAPVRDGDRLIGGVSFETIDAPREWAPAEATVAASVADIVALALGKAEQDAVQQELRAALAELERQKQALDRHAIVSTTTADGTITYVNDKFCEVSGYRAEELIGQNHRLLNSSRHEPAFFAGLWRTIAAGELWQGTLCNRAKHGNLYWVETTIVPFLDEAGRIERYTAIRTEVTAIMEADEALRRSNASLDKEVQQKVAELQRIQQQLLQSEKMASIGQLAAGVAHEINNPVGYITSNLGTLKNYVEDLLTLVDAYTEAETALKSDDPRLERIQTVKKRIELDFLVDDLRDLVHESQEGVERVKRIVQDLKDFSREREMEWEVSDLQRTLEATLNIVHNELKYKAEVIKEYRATPEVECVPSQLGQVFVNLLVNAAQAIEEHGTITVRTGESDGWAEVVVEDTGKGIPEENLTRLFDPFFTTKPVGQGTGLGLSVSYGIIQKHNGRIEVQSTPGKGTRFTIRLPLRQPHEADETKAKVS